MGTTESKPTRLHALYLEVNRLRKRDELAPIGVLTLAHKICRFHMDRNPRVAEALNNLDMDIKPFKSQ